MDNFQIETAQNVTIHQNVAHLGTRIGSYLIDGFIISIYTILIILFFGWLEIDIFQQWSFSLILGLPVFFYNLIFWILLARMP